MSTQRGDWSTIVVSVSVSAMLVVRREDTVATIVVVGGGDVGSLVGASLANVVAADVLVDEDGTVLVVALALVLAKVLVVVVLVMVLLVMVLVLVLAVSYTHLTLPTKRIV